MLVSAEEVEIALTRWKLSRDSEGGGSGSVVESDCVGQINAAIIVDEAGDGLKGDGVIVNVDGDILRRITVDIEDALTSMMECKRGRWKRHYCVVSVMWLAVSLKCDIGLESTTC